MCACLYVCMYDFYHIVKILIFYKQSKVKSTWFIAQRRFVATNANSVLVRTIGERTMKCDRHLITLCLRHVGIKHIFLYYLRLIVTRNCRIPISWLMYIYVCYVWNIFMIIFLDRSFFIFGKCIYTKVEKCLFHYPVISTITIIKRYRRYEIVY